MHACKSGQQLTRILLTVIFWEVDGFELHGVISVGDVATECRESVRVLNVALLPLGAGDDCSCVAVGVDMVMQVVIAIVVVTVFALRRPLLSGGC